MSIESESNRSQNQPAAAEATARFVGKVALVTGASDRGIGGAIAERLAREGAAVVMLSLHEPKRLLKRLHRLSAGSKWFHCDITKTANVKTAVDQSIAHFGRVDA